MDKLTKDHLGGGGPPPAEMAHQAGPVVQWRGWLCIVGAALAFVVLGQHGGLVPASHSKIGNVLLVILNVPLIGVWARMLRVPYRFLYPAALFFIAVGVASSPAARRMLGYSRISPLNPAFP